MADMQLHVSTSLATDLGPLLVEVPIDPRAMQWYGHRIQVLRRKCVIVMELKSRYAMVFTGLTKPDFGNFPALFRDRLCREAIAICGFDDARSARLAALADLVAEEVTITSGGDRSVQAHINEVAWELKWMAEENGSLPANAADEFGFGLRMNETPRSCRGGEECFFPLGVMRGFWVGLLDHAQPHRDTVVPFKRA